MKNIGKPCAGKPHARFDEGGLAKDSMGWLFRHRQTKGAETDMPIPTETGGCPLLYPFFRFICVVNLPFFDCNSFFKFLDGHELIRPDGMSRKGSLAFPEFFL